MADNVEITAGTGTSIATDDAGAGGQVQIVKLAIATNGSATLIPADGTDGILVNLGANNDVGLNAGTNGIGKLTANSGVDIGDVDVTSISAGTNAIGNVGLIGRTTGGLSIFRSLDLDDTEEEIKGTAGQLFGYACHNAAASTRFLKFYNATAANVTVGGTTPVITIPVPAGATANVSYEIGIAFGTAITAAVTTGVADADTGAPGANDFILNAFYV
jgi:hypothetical protein